ETPDADATSFFGARGSDGSCTVDADCAPGESCVVTREREFEVHQCRASGAAAVGQVSGVAGDTPAPTDDGDAPIAQADETLPFTPTTCPAQDPNVPTFAAGVEWVGNTAPATSTPGDDAQGKNAKFDYAIGMRYSTATKK